MTLFRDFSPRNNLPEKELNFSEKYSVYYHNIFDYPLTFDELIKWSPGAIIKFSNDINVSTKNGLYFIDGREGLIYKKNIRKRNSEKKIKIIKKAANILSLISTIKMVGITGSLAMQNAAKGDDLDLLIITRHGKLWTTRVLTYLLLKMFNFRIRKPNEIDQKDKLCLNLWLDENDMQWKKKERNLYTAHEILQIIPVLNKDNTYEKFISENIWARSYWPNAIEKRIHKLKFKHSKLNRSGLIERILFLMQYEYMKSRISKETVTPTRAIFHPQDLSEKIVSKLTY